MSNLTAGKFLNYCNAGLLLAGYEDGEYVFIGDDGAWNKFQQLEDGLPLEKANINW